MMNQLQNRTSSGAMTPDRFHYLIELSKAIYKATTVPMSLTHERNSRGEFVRFDDDKIIANVFLVAAQADNWGLDITSVLPETSIIRGRVVFSGKLINSVLQERYGIRLRAEWSGEAKTDERTIKVFGKIPGETEELMIEGDVKTWRTSHSGTPWQPATFDKMLYYRGAREWARMYRPSAMVGIIAEDEVIYSNTPEPDRIEKPTLSQALPGRQNSGFDPQNITNNLPLSQSIGVDTKMLIEYQEQSVTLSADFDQGDENWLENLIEAGGIKNPEPIEAEYKDIVISESEASESVDGLPIKEGYKISRDLAVEYSEALFRSRLPNTLEAAKKSFWLNREKNFDAESKKKLAGIYALHQSRVNKDITGQECEDQILTLIGA